ncbi:hypothetical protein HJ581_0016745 [Rhodococcus opacus]|uniref:hypothetical protein n=1 Tax=Rhodococcus opacus TaxID=37919 RepID=UPI0012FD05D1|nr:hypothetical protein [Rhodococcus opacus]MBA8961495.1 hypothetical protein [Rhodococcus opacus]MBP2202641.1 hypothetical protein [Rhodococcus opacus]WKN55319.1 hypothetical protein HJ581_0016745 [Rhodococcus opacus]
MSSGPALMGEKLAAAGSPKARHTQARHTVIGRCRPGTAAAQTFRTPRRQLIGHRAEGMGIGAGGPTPR